MGWSGYEDPREKKAADEAAQKMAEAQQLEDGRTEALCTAIVEGLGLVAHAILAAAGIHAPGVLDDFSAAAAGPDDIIGRPQEVADPDIDGLLDQGDEAAGE